MTKKSTKPTQNTHLILWSLAVTTTASAILGFILSQDQGYSPLPSLEGIIMTLLVMVGGGAFVGYANYTSSKSARSPSQLVQPIGIGLSAGMVGIFMMFLVWTLFIL